MEGASTGEAPSPRADAGTLDYRGDAELTDARLRDLVRMHPSTHRVDLSKCPKVTAEGVRIVVEGLAVLEELELENDCHLFSSWELLSQEEQASRGPGVVVEKAAIRALADHLRLRLLNIRGMQFIPEAALKLIVENHHLRSLDLGDCKHVTDEVIALLCTNTNLRELHILSALSMTDAAIESMVSLTELRRITLGRCTKLTNRAPALLGKLKKLEDFAITGNPSIACEFQEFDRHPCMKRMDLSGTGIGSTEISILSTMKQLKTLILDGCPNMDDYSVRRLLSATQLESLSVSSCPKLVSVNQFSKLTNLVELLLAGNSQITDQGVKDLAKLKGIERLNLTRCSLSAGVILKIAKGLPRLERLILVGCKQITDDCIVGLAALPSLKDVRLEETGLTRKSWSLLKAKQPPLAIVHALVRVFHIADFSGWKALPQGTIELLKVQEKLSEISFNGVRALDDSLFVQCATNCKALKDLDVRNTRVTKSAFKGHRWYIPAVGLNAVLDALECIDLSECPLVDNALMEVLANNTKAREVDLSNCVEITDKGLEALAKSNSIEKIAVRGLRRVTVRGLVALAKLPTVTQADLRDIRVISAEVVRAWGRKPKLVDFQCSEPETALSGDVFLKETATPCFPVMNAVVDFVGELNFDGNQVISDDALIDVLPNPNLRSINLSRCPKVGDRSLQVLSQNSHVEIIRLCDNTKLNLKQLIVPTKVPKTVWGPELTNKAALSRCATTALRTLDLSGCTQLDVPTLQAIRQHPALQHISLSDTNVPNSAMTELFKDNMVLTEVTLGGCKAGAFDGFVGNPVLEKVVLNKCSNSGDSAVKALSTVMSLSELHLIGTPNVTDAGLAHLSELAVLSRLVVRDNPKVTGKTLPKMPELKMLDLSGCAKVTSAAIVELAKNSSVLEWYLDRTGIDDKAIEALVLKRSATVISVSGCAELTNYSMLLLGTLERSVKLIFSDLSKVTISAFANAPYMPNSDVLEQFIAMVGGVDLTANKFLSEVQLKALLRNRQCKKLTFNECPGLTDAMIDLIGEAEYIERVSIDSCARIRKVSSLAKLRKCDRVAVSDCKMLSEQQIASLFAMPALDSLAISRCRVGEGLFQNMGKLRRVRRLAMAGIPALSVRTIGMLAAIPKLRYINMSDCPNVDDGCVRMLQQCRNLDTLLLNGCPKVTDVGVAYMADMKLKVLGLARTGVQGLTLNKLLDLKKLTTLDLSDCNLDVRCYMDSFVNCSLKKLVLDGVKNLSTGYVQRVFAPNSKILWVSVARCEKVSQDQFEFERRKKLGAAKAKDWDKAVEPFREPPPAQELPADIVLPKDLDPVVVVASQEDELLGPAPGASSPGGPGMRSRGQSDALSAGAGSTRTSRADSRSLMAEATSSLDKMMRADALEQKKERIHELGSDLVGRHLAGVRQEIQEGRSLREAGALATLIGNMRTALTAEKFESSDALGLVTKAPDSSKIKPLTRELEPKWRSICKLNEMGLKQIGDLVTAFHKESRKLDTLEKALEVEKRLDSVVMLVDGYHGIAIQTPMEAAVAAASGAEPGQNILHAAAPKAIEVVTLFSQQEVDLMEGLDDGSHAEGGVVYRSMQEKDKSQALGKRVVALLHASLKVVKDEDAPLAQAMSAGLLVRSLKAVAEAPNHAIGQLTGAVERLLVKRPADLDKAEKPSDEDKVKIAALVQMCEATINQLKALASYFAEHLQSETDPETIATLTAKLDLFDKILTEYLGDEETKSATSVAVPPVYRPPVAEATPPAKKSAAPPRSAPPSLAPKAAPKSPPPSMATKPAARAARGTGPPRRAAPTRGAPPSRGVPPARSAPSPRGAPPPRRAAPRRRGSARGAPPGRLPGPPGEAPKLELPAQPPPELDLPTKPPPELELPAQPPPELDLEDGANLPPPPVLSPPPEEDSDDDGEPPPDSAAPNADEVALDDLLAQAVMTDSLPPPDSDAALDALLAGDDVAPPPAGSTPPPALDADAALEALLAGDDAAPPPAASAPPPALDADAALEALLAGDDAAPPPAASTPPPALDADAALDALLGGDDAASNAEVDEADALMAELMGDL